MTDQANAQTSLDATNPSLEGEGSLLASLLEDAHLDTTADANKRGITSFLTELLRSNEATQRVAKDRIDLLIADIDRRLTTQVNAILHAPEVKALESAWRGVKYLVDEIDFRENVRLEFVNGKKEEFLADFREAPEITHSSLYKTIYKEAIGVYGGKPYGLICSAYDFGPGTEDVELLRGFASVGAMAHVPFLGNANPDMFGRKTFAEIPQLKDLQAMFEEPRYQRWNAFRDSEDARYVGMCMPRFMLRAPYGSRESELASASSTSART